MYASILAYSPNTDLLNATLYEALQQQRYSLADLQCAFPCSPDSALSRVLLPSLEETGLCAKGSNLSRGEQRGDMQGTSVLCAPVLKLAGGAVQESGERLCKPAACRPGPGLGVLHGVRFKVHRITLSKCGVEEQSCRH